MKGDTKIASPVVSLTDLWACARLALVLTAVVGLDTLLVLPFQRGPEVVPLAAAIFAGFALVIWCASLSIGLVVLLSAGAYGLLRRMACGRPGRPGAKYGLRDDWLDGPDLG